MLELSLSRSVKTKTVSSMFLVARHGPVTYKDKTEKYEFLELVSKVDEAGGGDCDELAISGIRDIFSSPLQYRSPIYVLTDAGPKDATEDHLDVVKEMVMECKTPINFFLSNAGKRDFLTSMDTFVPPISTVNLYTLFSKNNFI